eukprot:m.268468 g.268468  ORF g.268468 m.268468 type:complete len:54 (+) comp17652_c0_seq1:524-685(+)
MTKAQLTWMLRSCGESLEPNFTNEQDNVFAKAWALNNCLPSDVILRCQRPETY